MDVLTAAQLKKLFEACYGDRLEGVYVLGACCGLRLGEVLGLCWDDVDLDKGTIHVKRTLWRGKSYQPKTPHSRRIIKLPVIALDSLKRHAEKYGHPSEEWLFPNKTNTGPVDASNFWGLELEAYAEKSRVTRNFDLSPLASYRSIVDAESERTDTCCKSLPWTRRP